MTDKLSHIDDEGRAAMVDVSGKAATKRTAIARGLVRMTDHVRSLITENRLPKGDVLSTARIAGIMAAKKTSDLIPLCHPLALSKVAVDFDIVEFGIEITAEVTCTGPTGVEMEALTAVSVAALTLYDMVKAVDKAVRIDDIHLVLKDGGKSGRYEVSA